MRDRGQCTSEPREHWRQHTLTGGGAVRSGERHDELVAPNRALTVQNEEGQRRSALAAANLGRPSDALDLHPQLPAEVDPHAPRGHGHVRVSAWTGRTRRREPCRPAN
jgi:hypothetical protein